MINELRENVNYVEEHLLEVVTCKHASPELLELALDLHPEAIVHVNFELPERIQNVFVLTNDAVQHLVNPSETTQLLAVGRDARLVLRFANPCPAALTAAVKSEPKLAPRLPRLPAEAVAYLEAEHPNIARRWRAAGGDSFERND